MTKLEEEDQCSSTK